MGGLPIFTLHQLKRRTALWLAIVLTLSTLPFMFRTTHAQVPTLESIRVALYIQARGTVPAVTISSAAPMTLSYRSPQGTEAWVSSHGTFRSSLDQYGVVVAKTTQFSLANQIQLQIQDVVRGAYIYEQRLGSGVEYRVAAGPYATKQEAEAAKNALASLALPGGTSAMEISGPLYWSAGTYGDMAGAEQYKASLQAAGLPAYTVIHKDASNATKHSVWIGGVSDEAGLAAVKANAQKLVPGAALTAANTSLPYMVKRSDVTDGMNSAVAHYALQSTAMKLWVSSDQTVQVKERYARSYRGSLEITPYANSLAVINELPFEQYLVSVVGTEMGGGWPLEALKAQAVAARTYALKQGMKYGIAHISDTTFDQAYKGQAAESPGVAEAVQSTAGQVVVDKNGNLIDAIYSSNAGGLTADESEIWGTPLDHLEPVPSPDQQAAQDKLMWDYVLLPDGTIGYVRTDFTQETGQFTEAGFEILYGIGQGVNVRAAPYVENEKNPSIAQINDGDRLIRIDQQLESNSFSWLHGPYTGEQLLASINQRAKNKVTGTLRSLEVTERGASGRVTEVEANGQVIEVTTPDAYRTVFLSLPSTRFDIDEMGNFSMLGAGGVETKNSQGHDLYVLTGDQPTHARPLDETTYLAMSKKGEAALLSSTPMYRFVGRGYGHGLGMSQWGAKELAEYMDYDYKAILGYYYKNVQLVNAN